MPAHKNYKLLLPVNAYHDTDADRARAAQEATLGMLPPQTLLLRQACKPVPADALDSAQILEVIARLRSVAEGQRRTSKDGKRRRTLVGLAAPQIGEPWRIVLIDTKVDPSRKVYGKPECFINPVIAWRSRETAEDREGCFSAGPVWGLVRRSVAVKIQALTPEGAVIERIFEDFTARIAQHEIDHLDGIRFPERITSDRKRHWVHAEELPDYPEHIHHWPRTCSRERWNAFRQSATKQQM